MDKKFVAVLWIFFNPQHIHYYFIITHQYCLPNRLHKEEPASALYNIGYKSDLVYVAVLRSAQHVDSSAWLLLFSPSPMRGHLDSSQEPTTLDFKRSMQVTHNIPIIRWGHLPIKNTLKKLKKSTLSEPADVDLMTLTYQVLMWLMLFVPVTHTVPGGTKQCFPTFYGVLMLHSSHRLLL